MIFAAGLGTRLKGFTADKPKALVEIAGKTLLEHSITYLKRFGIQKMVVNVHHFPDQIIGFLQRNNHFGVEISISDERDILLDTGGGLKKASSFLQEANAVVLYNVDIFSDLNLNSLLEFHFKENALASLSVRKRDTSRYLLFDEQMQLTGWKNTVSGETKISRYNSFHNSQMLAFSGIHVVSRGIFDLISETGKFSIIDLYLRLAQKNTVKGFADESLFWLDLGKAEEFSQAEAMILSFQNKRQ